jgi:hypothetical protein
VQVLISNYQIPAAFLGPRKGPDTLKNPEWEVKLLQRRSVTYRNNAGYALTLDNLPADKTYRIQRYRISASSDLSLSESAEQRGPEIRLHAALPPPGIELIVLEQL